MKKYYKFGEMLLVLRAEYNSLKNILNQLNHCISIEDESAHFHFSGLLLDEDYNREIRLIVEKKYLEILKEIRYRLYGLYGQFLYRAYFVAEKQPNGLYGLNYDSLVKKYNPKVEIIDQNKFSELIDELLSSDLMQLKGEYCRNNHDSILLNFEWALIKTLLGDKSSISWDGIHDTFEYSITRHNCPMLIGEILSLEMPADKISPDWLKLLEKHENDFDEDLLFRVDVDVQSKHGVLQISDIENNKIVKMIKKVK